MSRTRTPRIEKGGGGRGTQVLLDGGLGGGIKMARWGAPPLVSQGWDFGVSVRAVCGESRTYGYGGGLTSIRIVWWPTPFVP